MADGCCGLVRAWFVRFYREPARRCCSFGRLAPIMNLPVNLSTIPLPDALNVLLSVALLVHRTSAPGACLFRLIAASLVEDMAVHPTGG